MKKKRFVSSLLTGLLVLALVITGVVSSPVTAYADAYNDYWNDTDDDYDDYWDDVDDDSDRSNKSSDYLKLRKSSKSTYFADTKNTKYGKYVDWCGRHDLLKGIAKKGGKVHPTKIVQERQLRLMLKNGYKDVIKVGSSKAKINQKYFCKTTKNVAKKLGYNLSWNNVTNNAQMSMGEVCYCYYLMVKQSKGTLYTYN